MTEHWFWFTLTMACLVWYSLVTVYVAVRGAYDIRRMLSHLEAKNKNKDENDQSIVVKVGE